MKHVRRHPPLPDLTVHRIQKAIFYCVLTTDRVLEPNYSRKRNTAWTTCLLYSVNEGGFYICGWIYVPSI